MYLKDAGEAESTVGCSACRQNVGPGDLVGITPRGSTKKLAHRTVRPKSNIQNKKRCRSSGKFSKGNASFEIFKLYLHLHEESKAGFGRGGEKTKSWRVTISQSIIVLP